MKYFSALIVSFFISSSCFSQDKIVKHTVVTGETIAQISQKYRVSPYEIYKLNPDAQGGLKPKTVLLIPAGDSGKQPKIAVKPAVSSSKAVLSNIAVPAKTKAVAKTHLIAAKDTWYSIGSKYGVSVEVLKKANPGIEKAGMKIGDTLFIPADNSAKPASENKERTVYHTVLPMETKYSISKQYGVTIEELEKKNPEIVANLPVGHNLLIKGTATKTVKPAAGVQSKKEVEKVVVKVKKEQDYLNYEVVPKETLYSLSNRFGLSQDELLALNPILKQGVVVGMVLKVPATTNLLQTQKKGISVLSNKSTEGDRKKLVLLMPFNLANVAGDSVNTTAMRLKKDKFLNMTLDFYSGALVAIDSAKQIGLPIDVMIFDSQETKNTSKVASIIRDNQLEDAAAVVGPFYQTNVEKTASLLSANMVPVISPLSKDVGNPYENLFQSIVSSTTVKNAMFDYMRSKEGNVIAVIDRKKESIIQYIQENQKDVKFAPLTVNGSLSAEGLNGLLVKDKKNFVVMETANTWMIKSTLAAIQSAKANYDIQLVILEPNETLDTDEIDFASLVNLKLMYPSMTRENTSEAAMLFDKVYKKKNKVLPNDFATRGFDITFDTMMRLSQGQKYQETVETVATEQVDNKFEYYKKPDGGYANKGVYILYYDSDLTVKEAK